MQKYNDKKHIITQQKNKELNDHSARKNHPDRLLLQRRLINNDNGLHALSSPIQAKKLPQFELERKACLTNNLVDKGPIQNNSVTQLVSVNPKRAWNWIKRHFSALFQPRRPAVNYNDFEVRNVFGNRRDSDFQPDDIRMATGRGKSSLNTVISTPSEKDRSDSEIVNLL